VKTHILFDIIYIKDKI